jgi:hypothetical protein
MRFRLMATYLGVPYQAGLGPDGTDVTLFSPGPPPDELGFTASHGHWRKQVGVMDLDALWQSRPVGDYRGEPCLVLEDLGARLHIAYLGRDTTRAIQLGYWEIDREVFEVVVLRQDIVGLTEERVDFPLAAAMFPSSGDAHEVQVPGTAPGASGVAAGPEPAAVSGSAPPDPPVAQEAARAVFDVAGSSGHDGGVPGSGPGNHASRVPDRAAAWHGSPWPELWPEPEPWPGPGSLAEPGSSAEPETWTEPGPLAEPGSSAEPETWTEPGPRTELEPRAELEPWLESGPLTEPAPRTEPGGWNGAGLRTEAAGRIEPRPGDPAGAQTALPAGRRGARKDRVTPQSAFAELLGLAAISQTAYAVNEEVPGAMCLVKADGGFEVFSCTDEARLEVRFFEDEEAAYFYLFGVLAAEAIRSGRLGPRGLRRPRGPGRANGHANGSGEFGTSPAATQNVSKYLHGKKLPESRPGPARVK